MFIFSAFWVFGLINNVLYVVILSAAVDLVGPLVPKSSVLLANILPSFVLKLSSPFFIHLIPYSRRIISLMVISTIGMLLVVYGSLPIKLFGITLASLSSGLGEVTFLQLAHFYEESSLNGWSSGTGGAGLVGSGVYLLFTTILKIDVKTTLLLFTVFPFGFLYYFKLPNLPEYQSIENEPLKDLNQHFSQTSSKILKLLKPFLLPLTSVYFAEYVINQAVSPTLLFPIENSPFERYRDIYVTYGTLYQLGVFISRSSASFIRIKNLYLPSILQFINLFILIIQSLFYFIPNVYIIMLIIFYEGLLGGAAYVNTFMLIIEVIPDTEREFCLGTVSMGDSLGVVLAALFGLWLEPQLCGYQVNHGREWCRMQ